MKITLATHIVVEHVGNQVFLLDSVGKEVYCLPAEGITHYTSETKTLVVTPELVPEVTGLVDSGVATTTGLISRRTVVGSTGALIGGGLVAMSMPAAASSQSPGPGQNTNGGGPDDLGDFDFFAFGTWEEAGWNAEDGFQVDVTIEFPDDLLDLLPPADSDGGFDWSEFNDWSIKLLGKTYTPEDLGVEDAGSDLEFELEDSDNKQLQDLYTLWCGGDATLEQLILVAILTITLDEEEELVVRVTIQPEVVVPDDCAGPQ